MDTEILLSEEHWSKIREGLKAVAEGGEGKVLVVAYFPSDGLQCVTFSEEGVLHEVGFDLVDVARLRRAAETEGQ